ncbi:hypothetical protein [Burkholderia sp. Ax-1724]|uniref:hypothetical protein n=1 Tax=Burkholderia sp. Ax-1724 TaxID=2608336 RepID=UPI00142415B8|nr:hypothetical protein [Burkholderia sp. Ax-1724]
MSTASEDRSTVVAEKIARLCKELEKLGFATSFFYRAPGLAQAPVAHLLIGETQ